MMGEKLYLFYVLVPRLGARTINCLGDSAGIESGHENTYFKVEISQELSDPAGLRRFPWRPACVCASSVPGVRCPGDKLYFSLMHWWDSVVQV